MKNRIILFIIIGLSAVVRFSSNTYAGQKMHTDTDSLKAFILAKEQAVLARWYNGDPLGFIDNSWEDVTYFDPSLASRADSIGAFRNILDPIIGKIHVPSHTMEKPFVRLFGEIAVLTFTDVFSSQGTTSRWHATEIYQHRGNDWKLIHSHWTESNVK